MQCICIIKKIDADCYSEHCSNYIHMRCWWSRLQRILLCTTYLVPNKQNILIVIIFFNLELLLLISWYHNYVIDIIILV